jgi:hypothetical protein
MNDAFLPVVTIDVPDAVEATDYVLQNVPSPGVIVIAKQMSQYNMYITQPDGQLPWVLYYDLGQHIYVPDVLLSAIPTSDIVEECEESCRCAPAPFSDPANGLDPDWVLALVRTVNESAKGGML